MATMNVMLPDHMREWVDAQVESGQYTDASDYMRDLIRRDEEYRSQRLMLVAELVEGETSGETDLTPDAIWRSVKSQRPLDV